MTDSAKKKKESGGRAVGSYLRCLREHASLTPTVVAAQLGTDATQIWRIENWKTDVRSSLLFGYIRIVNASPEDIDRLINDAEATEKDGEELAQKRINELTL